MINLRRWKILSEKEEMPVTSILLLSHNVSKASQSSFSSVFSTLSLMNSAILASFYMSSANTEHLGSIKFDGLVKSEESIGNYM